jgi:hypothetical protein
MSDSLALARVPDRVQYPPFKIKVPARACAEDLVKSGNATHELVTHARSIVFWLDMAIAPLGMSVSGLTVEDVLADLPDEVDRRIFACEELIDPLRLELVNPANCFTEGTFHAPSAHDAALNYAREIRTRLDLLARIGTKTYGHWGMNQLLPGSMMRGQWQEIVQVYREQMPDRFQGLPSVHSLLNRLIVETTTAIRARMEEADFRAGPPNRVRCEPSERGISLDGRQLATGLTAEQFNFTSSIVKAHPDAISFKKIMGGNHKGKNSTRVLNSLPESLKKIIVGAKTGYRLRLPSAKCHT